MTSFSKQQYIDYIFTHPKTQAFNHLRPIVSFPEHNQGNHSSIIFLFSELNITFDTTNEYINSNLYQERIPSTFTINTLFWYLIYTQQITTSLGAQIITNNNSSTTNLRRFYRLLSHAFSSNLSSNQFQLFLQLTLPKYLHYPTIKKKQNDDLKQKLIAYLPTLKAKSLRCCDNNNNTNHRQLHSRNTSRVVLYRQLLIFLRQHNPHISSSQSTLILNQIFCDDTYRHLYFSSSL